MSSKWVYKERAKRSGKRALLTDRHCLICNSDKTNVNSSNYPRWHRYQHGYICNTCKQRLRYIEVQQRGKELIIYA